MNNVKCKDVNRQCDFGDVFTKENIIPETNWVVDKTIGFDDIGYYEETGMFIKTIDKVKTCKYCGTEVIIEHIRNVVRKVVSYE